jgi:hypothetical protein
VREAVFRDFAPQTILECALANQVVDNVWRLKRLSHVESGMELSKTMEIARERADQGGYADQPIELSREPDLKPPRLVYPEGIGYEECAEEETAGAEEEEATGEEEEPYVYSANLLDMGQAFLDDAAWRNAYSKLHRYRTGIEHSLYRALRELQRLQESSRDVSRTGTESRSAARKREAA